jgi:hypothetical protein
MGMWPSSGHAMVGDTFHAEDMGLLDHRRVLYMLSLWRKMGEESMTNAISGCSPKTQVPQPAPRKRRST